MGIQRPTSMTPRLVAIGALTLLSGCVRLVSSSIEGEQKVLAVKGLTVADGDPLKFCTENPQSCSVNGPNLTCHTPSDLVQYKHSCFDPFNGVAGSRAKTYSLTVEVECSKKEPLSIDLDTPFEGWVELPAPTPLRRFIGTDTPAGRFPRALGHDAAEDGTFHDYVNAPAFTEVDVLREWPNRSRECNRAVVRVVDAGGAIEPGALVVVAKLWRRPPNDPPSGGDEIQLRG
jgi:hypothetical protein